jgi:uncharacterized phiE125 gp8 family phage protein
MVTGGATGQIVDTSVSASASGASLVGLGGIGGGSAVGESAPQDYTRAPAGAGYFGQLPTSPDTIRRLGDVVSAISLEAARSAARVDGDELDGEVLTAAAGYTADAEHETQRCFILQPWRASWKQFPPALQLRHSPLAHVASIRFYDQDGVQRTLDPQDYVIDSDSEPACIFPASGRAWPATAQRPNAVSVEYSAGYGPDESTVPAAVKMYVIAKVQQQFSPVANAKSENFDRLLDGLSVYG